MIWCVVGKFAKSLSRAVLVLKNQMDKNAKDVVITMANRVSDRTPLGRPELWTPPVRPKGYKEGHLINNWQITLSKDVNEIPGVDPGRTKSKARMKSFVEKSKVGGVYWVSNKTPYSIPIEEGHSRKQAPFGMMRLTMMEFGSVLRASKI